VNVLSLDGSESKRVDVVKIGRRNWCVECGCLSPVGLVRHVHLRNVFCDDRICCSFLLHGNRITTVPENISRFKHLQK
jgi:hypothetical protein